MRSLVFRYGMGSSHVIWNAVAEGPKDGSFQRCLLYFCGPRVGHELASKKENKEKRKKRFRGPPQLRSKLRVLVAGHDPKY